MDCDPATTCQASFNELAFEFAGWGSVTSVKLDKELSAAEPNKIDPLMGPFVASALAGNDLLGGVFYTIPAVLAVSGAYSVISLSIATLIPFLWRPMMEELGSALPISGGSYAYLLNVSTKFLALISAALLLLDFAATAVVSAATASSYLDDAITMSGSRSAPFPIFVGALLILALFMLVSLCGARESARVASGVLVFHLVTMIVLIIVSAVAWGHSGNGVLAANWHAGSHNGHSIAKAIWDGVCIGMLGLTGFECTPSYISKIKRGDFPRVLRNLHYPAIVLNVGTILVVLGLLPLHVALDSNTGGQHVLSTLGQRAGGKWLRTWVVIDAIVVLCGGVLTGILSAVDLFMELAHDRVLPHFFARTLPVTQSPYIAVVIFVAFSVALYASSGANSEIISDMFSVVWLAVMALFPISLILLKFNRPRLPREPDTSIWHIFFSLSLAIAIIVGNILIKPVVIGYFAAYFVALVLFFAGTHNKSRVLKCVYWVYDQTPIMHPDRMWGRALGSRRHRRRDPQVNMQELDPGKPCIDERMVRAIMKLRRQPVCVLVKSDEMNHLIQMVFYVRKNEDTSMLKFVHFYGDDRESIPSELEANIRIIDEAFPEMTIDLVLVEGNFSPRNLDALSQKLDVPRSLMFISCPGKDAQWRTEELGRIIGI
ncbi:AAAP amino acid permease [Coniophora puteana RWD-64-598 SS2]|uniref:AAAP amino acid permease n=1 Tax=Coniophora puteana (strain RWD-64-598) TaxID=741705 RepID=A0A5M3MM31_CONPW|nr:AAAP amino acid permease [Coniophora puteana RWD-64-598 SS2]EIW79641.1 AAAP amino acid permease [Coniophora puteana RWD-64-598 SS2]